jgi:hypothetical protein
MPDQPLPQPEKPIQMPEQESSSFAASAETPPVPEAPQEAPAAPEAPRETETPREVPARQKEEALEEGIEALKRRLRIPKKQKPTKVPQVRDELTIKVEKIMEEGLKDAYRELTPVQRQEFKIKGEETAFKIRQLLRSTRVKVKSIFKLLIEWLKLLPGVNRFFLEQEAKIKADKILALKEHIVGKK